MSIRLRLAIWVAAAIAIAGAGLLVLTGNVQREIAIAQARDTARSVNQITLAGLTAMMITGAAEKRALFLDQIEHAHDVRGLRVVRGAAVDKQYGPGASRERAADPVEQQVLSTGAPVFELHDQPGEEYLRAVMPALANRDFLGKDCIACHAVPEGTVLGAVTLEVDLRRIFASMTDFRREVSGAGLLFLMALGFLAYAAGAHNVSKPLAALTRSLYSIARGKVDLAERLEPKGNDEIAQAVGAFNHVLERAQQMVREELISADVFQHALEGILVTDPQGRIIKVNPAFTRTTGYSAEEAVGQTPRLLASGRQDRAFYQRFWEALTTKGEWQGDIWNRRKDGEVYPEWLNISCVRDEAGAIQNYVAVFSDITERKRQEALITHQATHDALTGLPNRLLFRDRLSQALALAKRNQEGLAVMFLDLDRFKHINDTYGHEAGDELLRQVAKRLRASVREADTVARLSGDEFTVLLPKVTGVEAAIAVADKILEAATQPYDLGGVKIVVTTSIGIGLYPEHAQDVDALLKAADSAMYDVKGLGRSGRSVFGTGQARRVSA